MEKMHRARYTLEYKLEALRLIGAGQSIAAVAAVLGLADQTLYNWIKAQREGRLGGPGAKPVSAEQMELARLRAELARTKMELAIIKKAAAYFARESALLAHIRAIHAQVKGECGWPRMWKELLARGIRVGKERVRKLMAQHGIKAKTKRKFKATTNSKHDLAVAPNLIERDFAPVTPNAVWTTDITYLATNEGWLYLTVMLDLFSRQVVGWSIGPRMTKKLVTDALRMAWFRRKPAPGLIVHSDRGSQYCSAEFQDALRAYGMKSSMSRKADCWDNAPTESLWGSLKRARTHGRQFATRQAAQSEVMDWLAFYNATRLHSTLGYVSPMKFEKNWLAAQERKSA